MELNDIHDLWNQFENSNLTLMELEYQGVRMKLEKGTVSAGATKQAGERISANPASAESGNPEAVSEISAAVVTSPLVGTFYTAAAPGEKPFAEPGKPVKKGDVLGIVEAMKMMNEIIAPQDGVIAEVRAEDASLVEYGQVLFVYQG